MQTVLITGNTYPVKEAIKALGGRWDKRGGGWQVPADKADEARALVAAAPASTSRRRGSTFTRFSGAEHGGEHYQNRRGRCEDAPCCGCCS